MRAWNAVATVVVFAACPPAAMDHDAGVDAPIITSVSPTSGPLAGGTVVTVNGTNFVQGAVVKFGDNEALSSVESARRLTATSPAASAPGAVTLTVTNPDGQRSTLNSAFTYLGTTVQKSISAAQVVETPDVLDESEAAMVSVTVSAEVQVPQVTPGSGQGAGVRAEVGYASALSTPPASGDFTWSAATYVSDQGERDRYRATLALPGVGLDEETVYWLAARFSVDDGQTWTLADRNGIQDGLTEAELPKATIGRSAVNWCKLGGQTVEAPPVVTLRPGEAGPVMYAQVYEPTVTTVSGPGAGLVGQLGYGAPGTPSTWTWVNATYNVDTGAGANDEYQATLPNPGLGVYAFAYRFSLRDAGWRYCDADGLDNGFTDDQVGTLRVQERTIESCKIQFPPRLEVLERRSSPLSYGRVFVPGVTPSTGADSDLEGQLGFGPVGTLPDAGSWTWSSNAPFNTDDGTGGDEYQQSVLGPTAGTYAYAWRFRIDRGAWSVCDLNGSQDGIQSGQLGVLTSTRLAVESCRLERVSAFSLESGGALTAAARLSLGSATALDGGLSFVRVQIGIGPQGDNASSSQLWGWKDAPYARETDAGDEYELRAFPAYTGARAVSARASVDGGAWVYCDLDGIDDGGYAVTQQYDVTVTPHTFFDFCNTQFPASGPAGAQIYGQIYEPGLTPDAAVPFRAELGVGTETEDPGFAWTWRAANGNGVSGNNNEYQLPVQGDAGLHYAFRFSLDGGGWCYGDLNGSQDGFTGGANTGVIVP